jgi:hypothetical protein
MRARVRLGAYERVRARSSPEHTETGSVGFESASASGAVGRVPLRVVIDVEWLAFDGEQRVAVPRPHLGGATVEAKLGRCTARMVWCKKERSLWGDEAARNGTGVRGLSTSSKKTFESAIA